MEYLRNNCQLYAYNSRWSAPETAEYDFMEFQIVIDI
jgi:hypothetical protein